MTRLRQILIANVAIYLETWLQALMSVLQYGGSNFQDWRSYAHYESCLRAEFSNYSRKKYLWVSHG